MASAQYDLEALSCEPFGRRVTHSGSGADAEKCFHGLQVSTFAFIIITAACPRDPMDGAKSSVRQRRGRVQGSPELRLDLCRNRPPTAPSAAKSSAAARPMLPPVPVMTQTLPFNRIS